MRREIPTERSLELLLKRLGFEPESVYRSETGIEVKLEVSWDRLPRLVKELERRYRLVSLSAVDNAGKGIFKVRFVVR
jgi:hypothetical protein